MSEAKHTHRTMKKLLKAVFSMRYVPSLYIAGQKENLAFLCRFVIEYLHRSPASRKRRQCPVVYLGHPVPEGYKYRDLALQVGGVSRIGKIKYGLYFRGTQTPAGLRWRGSEATVNFRTVLASERALQNNKPAIL
jgi:hypothetical protein